MKIGFNAVLLEERISGITEYISNLLSTILKIDISNEYICYFSKLVKDDDLCNYQKAKCVKTNLTNFSYKRILQEQFYWPEKLKEDKIDIYHSPFFHIPLKIPCKILITVQDLIPIKYPETITKIRALFLKFAVSYSIKKADKIIAASYKTKEDIMEIYNIPSSKIEVVYHGVNKNYKNINNMEILEEIRKKLNLPEKYLLFVGHLEPRKNLERLIKTYKILKEEFKIKEKLLIVGKENWLYKSIYEEVKKNKLEKDIIFTGYISKNDLLYIYNLAYLFIFPSLYEGFGLPPLEAMSCGVPVVASNVPPISEVVANAALLINPYDLKDMAEKIYLGINNQNIRTKLINNGFEQVKLFNWNNAAEKTIKIYQDMKI